MSSALAKKKKKRPKYKTMKSLTLISVLLNVNVGASMERAKLAEWVN